MATAKKCDRCGKLYDGYKGKACIDGKEYIHNGVAIINRELYGNQYCCEKSIDLCQTCRASFIWWLQEEPEP